MELYINEFQLRQLFEKINSEYKCFAPLSKESKLIFGETKNFNEIRFFEDSKIIIPFKNVLLPDGFNLNQKEINRFAFWGLNNCDAWALNYLIQELAASPSLPKEILVITSECIPNQSCFCHMLGLNKIIKSDLHLQKEGANFAIFSGTKKGDNFLKLLGINESKKRPKLKEINLLPGHEKMFNKTLLSEEIENKERYSEYWEKIANNCFGCGACSEVCPLCFCLRQNFENEMEGNCRRCAKWDSCFAKEFSEIQHHYDLRPENTDRLYNWYHHKFVRSFRKNKRFLCTGCGRCIEACPASLNVKYILSGIIARGKNAV